jgi:DNA-binding MarR family transcriptional regulator
MKTKNDIDAITPLMRKLMDSFHYLARNILREEDLSLSQYYVLHLIKTGPQAQMKNIKNNLCVSGAYATSIIDKLVKKGFIERYRGKDDRRVVRVKLTDKGKILIRDLNNKKAQFYTKLLKDMNGKDKKTMSDGLSLLVSSLSRILGKY